jgi:hypothetical protein
LLKKDQVAFSMVALVLCSAAVLCQMAAQDGPNSRVRVAVAAAICSGTEPEIHWPELQLRRALVVGTSLRQLLAPASAAAADTGSLEVRQVLLTSGIEVEASALHANLSQVWDELIAVPYESLALKQLTNMTEGYLWPIPTPESARRARADGNCTALRLHAWGLASYTYVLLLHADACLLEDPRPFMRRWVETDSYFVAAPERHRLPGGFHGVSARVVWLQTDPVIKRLLLRKAALGDFQPFVHTDQDILDTVFPPHLEALDGSMPRAFHGQPAPHEFARACLAPPAGSATHPLVQALAGGYRHAAELPSAPLEHDLLASAVAAGAVAPAHTATPLLAAKRKARPRARVAIAVPICAGTDYKGGLPVLQLQRALIIGTALKGLLNRMQDPYWFETRTVLITSGFDLSASGLHANLTAVWDELWDVPFEGLSLKHVGKKEGYLWPLFNNVQSGRKDGACTSLKLHAWGMTDYDFVMMHDADACFLADPRKQIKRKLRSGALFATLVVSTRMWKPFGGLQGFRGFGSAFVWLQTSALLRRVLVDKSRLGDFQPFTYGDQDIMETVFAPHETVRLGGDFGRFYHGKIPPAEFARTCLMLGEGETHPLVEYMRSHPPE